VPDRVTLCPSCKEQIEPGAVRCVACEFAFTGPGGQRTVATRRLRRNAAAREVSGGWRRSRVRGLRWVVPRGPRWTSGLLAKRLNYPTREGSGLLTVGAVPRL
jgi:hypothetical protein